MKKILKKISKDRIKIEQNKNPIKMETFLSFLTVDVKRSKSHLGYANGWTLLIGDNNLLIGGGTIDGVEYLNTIQYKKNLDNGYNNYVNPFYLKDIITHDGLKFFINYYEEEISNIKSVAKMKINMAQKELEHAIKNKKYVDTFWEDFIK